MLTNNITSANFSLDADGDGLSNLHEMKSQYELIQGSYTWEEARIDAISRGHLATQYPLMNGVLSILSLVTHGLEQQMK